MRLEFERSFEQDYAKSSAPVRKKIDKALQLLLMDFRHPSLLAKKMKGNAGKLGIYEARVDYAQRMTFMIVNDTYMMRHVGKHDILRNP